jgi:hypothetical protein
MGFIKKADWQDLQLQYEVFLEKDDKGVWIPKKNTFQRFAMYLYDHKDGMSPSTFKSCMAFAWNRLNEYLSKCGSDKVEEGYIMQLPGVREVQNLIETGWRTRGMTHMLDVQADLEAPLEP